MTKARVKKKTTLKWNYLNRYRTSKIKKNQSSNEAIPPQIKNNVNFLEKKTIAPPPTTIFLMNDQIP